MPLHDGIAERIREQLHRIARNDVVPVLDIGYLTYQQLQHVCDCRRKLGLAEVGSPTILYIGRHHYQSRSKQGYTIDDMILQIQASTSSDCEILIGRKMTVMRAAVPRPDGYGNQVRDEAVLELTRRKPRIELFSVVPKGDTVSPLHKQQSPS